MIRGLADDPSLETFARRVAQGLHLLLQLVHLATGAAQLHAGRESGQQLFLLPRLGDEVGGTGLDGTHGLVGVGIGGHEDDHRLRVDAQDLLQRLETLLPAHHVAAEIHVQQDEVGAERAHEVLDALRADGHLDFLRIGFQQEVEGEEHVFVVVYDEDFSQLFHIFIEIDSGSKDTHSFLVLCVRSRTIFVRTRTRPDRGASAQNTVYKTLASLARYLKYKKRPKGLL